MTTYAPGWYDSPVGHAHYYDGWGLACYFRYQNSIRRPEAGWEFLGDNPRKGRGFICNECYEKALTIGSKPSETDSAQKKELTTRILTLFDQLGKERDDALAKLQALQKENAKLREAQTPVSYVALMDHLHASIPLTMSVGLVNLWELVESIAYQEFHRAQNDTLVADIRDRVAVRLGEVEKFFQDWVRGMDDSLRPWAQLNRRIRNHS